MEISVRKDKVIEVTILEGWYGEHEMSQDLKWSAWDAYYLDLLMKWSAWDAYYLDLLTRFIVSI